MAPGAVACAPIDSLFAALGLVFVAELGDKTQLVALGFGARHRLAPVLAGMALAYAVVNLISVVIGGLFGAALPDRAVGIAAGVLFVGFGLWTLRAGEDEEGAAAGVEGRSVLLSVALAVGVAELGDKTMLATAALASRGDPVLTWVGATIGIIAAGALGVAAGRVIGARVPERITRIGAAILFIAFGIVLLVTSV